MAEAIDLIVDGTAVGEAEVCVEPVAPEFTKMVRTPEWQAEGLLGEMDLRQFYRHSK